MTTLEQVEKLRERADVTFEEAKAALEQSGGDLLDALIYLERQGKTAPPSAGGFYSGAKTEADEDAPPCRKDKAYWKRRDPNGDGFRAAMKAFGSALLRIINAGNDNYIDAIRHENIVFSCPVTVFIILLICAFWVIIPLIIISVFFGWRLRLRGPNLGSDAINNVIASAEEAAQELKNTVVESAKAATAKTDENVDETEKSDTENV